jgi:hypothetical protein
METAKPSTMRLRAKPRRRLNHWDTRLLQFSIMEPWPRNRRAAKPMASQTTLTAAPKAAQARPSSTTTKRLTRRAP